MIAAARQHGLAPQDFIVRAATRHEVPFYLAAADVQLFFIKNSYSKKASSPVKLGESLAMGLPVMTNTGVGDVDSIIKETKGGLLIENFTNAAYEQAVLQLPALLKIDREQLRQRARSFYDLEAAVNQYESIYRQLI